MIARYYNWLSRYQRVTGWATRAGRAPLTVHRRLAPPLGASAGEADGVHVALLGALGAVPEAPRSCSTRCTAASCSSGSTAGA